MAQFEEAIQFVMTGGKARRACWARVPEYTQATPPISYERTWRIWSVGSQIVQGWGGQVGALLATDDPIRDGTSYRPTDEDRTAVDWELMQVK